MKCWFSLPKSSFGRVKLQGWACKNKQKTRTMRWWSWTQIFWCFLCNHIAMMGIQTQTCMRTTKRLLCNNIARMGIQTQTNMHAKQPNTQGACEQSDVCFVTNACSPNEDFGRPNQHFRMRSQRTLSIPNEDFWKAEQTFQSAFSKHFSRVWVPDLGYETLKSASKTHSEMFVRPSKIFVWGACICKDGFPKTNKHARCIDDRLMFSL